MTSQKQLRLIVSAVKMQNGAVISQTEMKCT